MANTGISDVALIAYHGTVWERPLLPDDESFQESAFFDRLSANGSELRSVFFSDQEQVAAFFSDLRRSDEQNELPVILRGVVQLERIHRVRVGASGVASWNGKDYLIPESRREFYEAVRADGYDGVMMLDDYKTEFGPGHDVAVFNEAAFSVESVRLCFDGVWSPWLNYDKALGLFKSWSGDEAMEFEDSEPECSAGW